MPAIIIDEAVTELRTLRDMLRWAISQFNQAELCYGHGTDNAWDEAVYLVLSALHLPPDVNPQVLDARLTLQERQAIAGLIKRRVTERVPTAYLIKEAWFAGLPFYVDERVLIPRSPIAELIERQFVPWIAPENVNHILDVCTGSGCIAIACALAFPEALVDATDISTEALVVADINRKRHQVEEQVQFFQGDLFASLPSSKKYDIIVSNPPYVAADEMAALPGEYRHEPALGLVAGTEGLDIALNILRAAKNYLTPDGILIVEVGNSEQALCERFPQLPFSWLEFERGGGGVFLLTAEQLSHEQNF